MQKDDESNDLNQVFSTPDERALVQAAAQIGYKFTRKNEHVRVKALDKVFIFKVLAEFPFDSVRKMMSVIV